MGSPEFQPPVPPEPAGWSPQITAGRVKKCEESALFWANNLPGYGQRMRSRADTYKIVTSVLSTVTALGVWTTLEKSTHLAAVIVVSVIAVCAGLAGVIPQQRGYARCADAAEGVADSYGNVYGDLMTARENLEKPQPDSRIQSQVQAYAAKTIDEFEQIRSKKMKLHPYPHKLQRERKREREGQVATTE